MLSNKLSNWLIHILISIIWGSSYYLIKLSLVTFSPVQVGLIRITLSGLALLPFLIYFSRGTSKTVWFWCAMLGVIGFFLPFMCFAIAQTVINSSLAGMLNSLQPLFTLIIGILVFKQSIPRHQIIGVIIGFAGAIILLATKSSVASNSDNFFFSLLVVLATLCYGIATNLIRAYLHDVSPLKITSLSLGILILPTSLSLLLTDTNLLFQAGNEYMISLTSLITLSLLGTSFAVILYNQLLQSAGILMASSVAYLIPVVAISWGVIGGETIYITHIIGICVIFTGLYLTSKSKITDSIR